MSYQKSQMSFKVFIGVMLAVLGILTFFPFLWMIFSSLKTNAEISQMVPTLLPKNPTLNNFKELFERLNFGIYLKNTLIVTLFSFLGLFLNAMAGYGFSKYDFKGKHGLFLLVLATMMIPGQVTMIPVYLILNSVGLTNTLMGIVLPGLAGAFGIFLFRQFMSTISDELLEAARLDGANEWYIFFRIVLPLTRPILAVQGILTFIGGWNSFLWPLIIANDEKYYTLSVGLQLLQGQHGTDYSLQMAGATFMVVPILIIFMIFQKYILQGFNVSGIK
ncbi:carbohydrate ABC transporter permease [Enterococcus italicus]|jgi:multiple sugar transport system permease protein|uniref:ABC transporter, permease protein n=1 Tax=Enterococcus italicus (strain DSM 15952 / CCUG 50447 / LMG 22039 / TP 1.5) TaxID=888064 RepID=E6LD96_ENTI1|nr:carbohydrate ABC transporter permease [Enterococcus italicus]EFU74770.1 ABC transporter, permease protein [Enterococcus italicus DSM 15952]OJG60647.1 sugar ABC transporter permease [Enterococcus italicus DSM 15952]